VTSHSTVDLILSFLIFVNADFGGVADFVAFAQQSKLFLHQYLLHVRNSRQKTFSKTANLLIISAIAQIIALRKMPNPHEIARSKQQLSLPRSFYDEKDLPLLRRRRLHGGWLCRSRSGATSL
jgi:hypothetical protein